MPLITKVKAQKRPNYYNIFLDGHYAFSASAQTVAEFVLLQGKTLALSDIEKIKAYDADAKAAELAANYLNYQPRTIYEISHYLNQHQISEQAAQNAIQELVALGYLDDTQYVQLWLKNDLRIGRDGPQMVTRKLALKGVSSEIIAIGLDKIEIASWQEVGQRVIKTMGSQHDQLSSRELNRKMMMKLAAHGFNHDLASKIVAEMAIAPSATDQLNALKRQGIKAYKRYRNKPEFERRQKMKTYLFQHGFSSAEISAFLDGTIISFEELNDY